MYCWGNTASGELGLGGIEEQQIDTPRHLSLLTSAHIAQVVCGYNHTLFRTADGEVLSCGNNDSGQLGHTEQHSRPARISALENYKIKLVCAGDQFSLAVTTWGGVFSWGINTQGQLGTGDTSEKSDRPRQLKVLSTRTIVQAACGRSHALALAQDGEVFAWGANDCGQLGSGCHGDDSTAALRQPTPIACLSALPLARIACGGYHCLALTKCGLVLSWGRNTFKQLGLASEQDVFRPTPIRALQTQKVRHVTAGESHSAALTQDGAVFTFGAGMYGQLGHGSKSAEVRPRQVTELMGSRVTQLVCGRYHTMVYVAPADGSSVGKVMTFGLGGSGQLGCGGELQLATLPQAVSGPWTAGQRRRPSPTDRDGPLLRTAGGGHQSFVLTLDKTCSDLADDRVWREDTQILELTSEAAVKLQKLPSTPAADEDEDQARHCLIEYAETVLNSAVCLNGSFLPPAERRVCTDEDPRVDISACQAAFRALLKSTNDTVIDLVASRLASLPASLPVRPLDIEALRVFVLLFLDGPTLAATEPGFSAAFLRLADRHRGVVSGWLRAVPAVHLLDSIRLYKQWVLRYIRRAETLTQCPRTGSWMIGGKLETALKMLRFLHSALMDDVVGSGRMASGSGQSKAPSAGTGGGSGKPSTSTKPSTPQTATILHPSPSCSEIADETFYIPELTELVSIPLDFVGWQLSSETAASGSFLCNYPFVFDAVAKTQLLQTDALMQMRSAMESAAAARLASVLLTGQPQGSQFLTLVVSREKLVEETLQQLGQSTREDLKKPLKVKFIGEEGEDAGGVRKEFFLVLTRALLDPSYGMFRAFDDTHRIWFSQDSYEDSVMYFLIGIVCGLAIYNSTIINSPFPLALYKKLLGQPVSLQDLAQLDPVTARSLQSLLDYKGDDVEDVFCLSFEISREVYGEAQTTELMPGGSTMAVTNENREEYVRLYVHHVLNASIEAPYKAFQHGFLKVCGGKVLHLFTAAELMTLVTGHEQYDWDTFEAGCEYREGYTRESQPCKLFWKVFHDLTEEQKKRFLLFLTGTDRVPITGMKAIKMFIQPARGGETFLPVAHTCFNLLDLPEYTTAERLKYKLLQAIDGAEGFALA